MNDSPPSFRFPGFAGRVGLARWDITPPPDAEVRNWGAADFGRAEGIHRPLAGTVLALRETEESAPLVLASLNLGWWRRQGDLDWLGEAVRSEHALPPSHFILHLTHTHAGPSLMLLGEEGPTDYARFLREGLLEAVRAALAGARPSALHWRQGRCGLAANRDLPDPDNPSRYLVGWNPDAPADDALLVGDIRGDDGERRGTIVNYACHPTTLGWKNRLISPDYVGALQETVEAQTGGAPCLFLLGACGELAPPEQYSGDADLADRHGREIGFAALSVLQGMGEPATELAYARAAESGAPLALWERRPRSLPANLEAGRADVALDLKTDLPSETEILAALERETDPPRRVRLERKLHVRRQFDDSGKSREAIWYWRIGDTLLAASPFEAYSDLQTGLRAAFPGRPVLVANICNGHKGYLPPADLYGQDRYAVWQTPFAQGSLETVSHALATQLHSLLDEQSKARFEG